MKKTVAIAVLALTSMFSFQGADAQDVAKDPANDGKTAKFVKNGAMVEIFNKEDGKQKGDHNWILIETGKHKSGDSIYRIKKAGVEVIDDLYLVMSADGKLKMESPVVTVTGGGKKTKDVSKISTWTLHLGSKGWSIMSAKNGAMAVSRNKKNKDQPYVMRTELQRNQGYPKQTWMIRQVGFAVNPEL